MIFDDIGSFPLPEGISREWVEENIESKEYSEMVQRAFLMKLNAGVELPNYPQFRDMNKMFLDLIKNPNFQEDAYLIKRRFAKIREVEALMEIDIDKLRVCITGPFELYYNEFGAVIYDDILENLAKSLSRFIENLNEKVECISIDEPSLGTNPELQPRDEQLLLAFEKIRFSGDVQIHLHSPLFYTRLLEIESIDIIGIEAAKDERNMIFIDKEELESHEKFLRVGIARSDIDGIIAEYNSRFNTNAWKDKEEIFKAIEIIESVDAIRKRIEKAISLFDERLKYIGPDCGLFSFPSQLHAVKLLENVKIAKEDYE